MAKSQPLFLVARLLGRGFGALAEIDFSYLTTLDKKNHRGWAWKGTRMCGGGPGAVSFLWERRRADVDKTKGQI